MLVSIILSILCALSGIIAIISPMAKKKTQKIWFYVGIVVIGLSCIVSIMNVFVSSQQQEEIAQNMLEMKSKVGINTIEFYFPDFLFSTSFNEQKSFSIYMGDVPTLLYVYKETSEENYMEMYGASNGSLKSITLSDITYYVTIFSPSYHIKYHDFDFIEKNCGNTKRRLDENNTFTIVHFALRLKETLEINIAKPFGISIHFYDDNKENYFSNYLKYYDNKHLLPYLVDMPYFFYINNQQENRKDLRVAWDDRNDNRDLILRYE